MIFKLPTLLRDAVRVLRDKGLLPTQLGSAALRRLAASVRRRSIFSARMTQIKVVQRVKDALDAMLRGESNLADAKLEMEGALDEMGYRAETGFPGDEGAGIPPAAEGSLRDLRSEQRKELVLRTQFDMAANEAFVESGLTKEARWQFPAWELVRTARREVPRGMKRRKEGLVDDPGQDWPSRWVAAGGELWDRGSRMIAPKDSEVWQALGDGAGGFEADALGNAFPPYAFNSGMGLLEVPREECLLLGVIEEAREIEDVKRAPNIEAEAPGVDDETLSWWEGEMKRRAKGGKKLTVAERLKRAGKSAEDIIKAGAANSLHKRCNQMLEVMEA